MRIFRTTYKDRRGQRRKARRWYVEFTDHLGTRRRIPALEDRRQSEAIGRKIEELVNRKAARESLPPDLTAWLEGLPDRLRRPLARWGLLDAARLAAMQMLHEHLDDFAAALTAKDNTARHVALVTARARKLIDGCRFTFWTDISASKVSTCLADLRADRTDAKGDAKRGISAQTSNFYLAAVKSFCRWMVRDGRATQSPVAHLDGLNVKTDRRRDRRALSVEELRKLLEVARGGPERFGMAGTERAMLYRLAAETGLRRGELASLTRSSFALDGQAPTVAVEAAYSKHRRRDLLPLREDSAAIFRDFLAVKLPSAPAFAMPESRHDSALMFRQDVEAAGLPYVDEAGRYADFHSLRHTFGTNLARAGIQPKQAMDLMRHSDINLTMARYSHTVIGEQAAAVAALPDLNAPARRAARATGTEDAKAAPDAARCPRNDDLRPVRPGLPDAASARPEATRAVENGHTSGGADETDDPRLALCLAQSGIPGTARLGATGGPGGPSEGEITSTETREKPMKTAEFRGNPAVASNGEGGIRTHGAASRTPVFETGQASTQVADTASTYDTSPDALGRALGAFADQIQPLDAPLAGLLRAWVDLPEPVRSAIATMARQEAR